MIIARQSTDRTMMVGPVLDASGVAVTDCVIGDFKISKNGAAPAALNASATLTHRNTGHYSLLAKAADLSDVGQAEIVIDDTVNACPTKEITVLEEAVYDALFAASALGYVANAPVSVAQWLGVAPLALSSQRVQVHVGAFDNNVLTENVTSAGLLSELRTYLLGQDTAALQTDATGYVKGSAGTGTGQWSLVAGVIAANLTQIDGLATNGNNATLNLAQLNIVNSAGSAIIASSTGNNGHGVSFSGNGSGNGVLFTGGSTGIGMRVTGPTGMSITGTGGNAITAAGTGTGSGMRLTGGATGDALMLIGGSTSGHGLNITVTSGNGFNLPSLVVSGATTLTGAFSATNASNDIRGVQVNDHTAASLSELRTYLHGADVAGQLDASGYYKLSDGTGTGQVDLTSGLVKISGTKQTLDDLQDLSAAGVWDLANGIETGFTPRQTMRGFAAVLLGLINDAGTNTETFRAMGAAIGGTVRVTATVDSSGNRSGFVFNL
jgi:hypothetical protein